MMLDLLVLDITIDPTLLTLGPFVLGWHGIFTAAAVMLGLWLGVHRAEARGLPAETITNGAWLAVLGGFVGARLFHVFDHLDAYTADPLRVLLVWEGGMAAYGGFVGGVLVGIVYAARTGLPIWRVLDAAAPAMIVGQIVGRCGCLVNGDAWGGPTSCPCGVTYWHPHAAIPADLLGVPTHPYPVYEIVLLGLLLAVLLRRESSLRVPGMLFLVTVAGYAAVRFGASFVRQEPIVWLGLQEAQVVALLTGGLALVLLALRWTRPVAT